jgi:hypothetical protein
MPSDDEIEKLKQRAKGIKLNPYEHINIRPRTLDIFIAAVTIAAIIFIVLALIEL